MVKELRELKIVHLAIDDKFIGGFFIPNVKRFGDINENKFYILYNGKPQFEILDNSIDIKYIDKKELNELFNSNFRAKKIIIHCFIQPMEEIILSIPEDIKIITIVYGHEYYKRIPSLDLIDSFGIPYVKQSKVDSSQKKYSFKTRISYWLSEREKLNKQRKVYGRINSIAHYIFDEYFLFKKNLKMNASFLEFNMGTLSQILTLEDCEGNVNGNNILLGNSANITNNHLSIINNLNLDSVSEDACIYCPMSYSGSSDDYTQAVIEEGRNKFGNRFIPLLEFMKVEEYNNILSSCNKVVLNQHRSQGGASVFSALYRGSDLYLSKKNPFYNFFTEMGVIIFPIIEGEIDLNRSLNEEERTGNRNCLVNYFSDDMVNKRYQNLLL